MPEYKLSGALIDLVEPWMTACDEDSLDSRRKIFTLAAFAWNLASLPDGRREENLRKAIDELSRMTEGQKQPFLHRLLRRAGQSADYLEARSAISDLLAALMARKNALYPSDLRMILNVDVVKTADGYHVTVASAALPDEAPEQLQQTG